MPATGATLHRGFSSAACSFSGLSEAAPRNLRTAGCVSTAGFWTWLCLALLALATARARGDGPADFLVDRLSLDVFKSTIYDLAALETRYWDRPQNLTAEDYIKAKLESYGYTNVVMDAYAYSGKVRHNVYATKMGVGTPTQMYIVGAHLDSFNIQGDYDHCPGADDDASGVAAVLETARVLAQAQTDLSVRLVLWNNEETGLNGSGAYVTNHRTHQGTLDEPTWLGMIQLDMILYDHGPGPIPDADVEYQALHGYNGQAIILAQAVADAMTRYGDIPAEVGNNMNYTDSVKFWNYTAAISIRENQRISELGQGSNPYWHQATDLYDTYSDADYLFGFNIVKMLTGAVGELAGARPRGDLNCDGVLNLADLEPFVLALTDPAAYQTAYPDCNIGYGDCNGDGLVDPFDIDPFVECIVNGGCP